MNRFSIEKAEMWNPSKKLFFAMILKGTFKSQQIDSWLQKNPEGKKIYIGMNKT
jgi:hypothetical protein